MAKEARTLFLKEFTRHLLFNSLPEDFSSVRKQTASKKPEETLLLIPPPQKPEKKLIQEMGEKTELKESPIRMPQPPTAKPLLISHEITKTKPLIQLRQKRVMPVLQKPRYQLKPVLPSEYQPSIISQAPTPAILPSPSPLPPNFSLGKLDFLIQDPRVNIIECPGPEKFVLVRISGQPTLTKISLTKEEISDIIDKFSQASRIPVLSGLFKAAVGNLLITAVVSETIGSRFVITKITPYSILDGKI